MISICKEARTNATSLQMVVGATRDDLVDVCMSVPFTSASNSTKRLFEPNGSVLKDEISRRVHFLVRENEHNLRAVFNRGKVPHPHNWSKPRCIEWLEDPRHAIASNDDLEFLAIQLEILKGVVKEAMKEEAVGQDISEWDKRKFGGIHSCARLIHCVIDDVVKPLLLTRRVALSHQQMDAIGTSSEVRIFGLSLQNSSTKAHFTQSLTSCLFMTLGISSLHRRC